MRKPHSKRRMSLLKATLEGEIWKDIEGFDGKYKISNFGRTYSFIAKRILDFKPHKIHGYCGVCIGEKGNRKHFKTHRLVAQAFLSNPENKKEVNHKDKNRTNNCIENLEWNTPYENTQHKYGKGVWNNSQGSRTPSHYSVNRKKLEIFEKRIIPIIQRLVPFTTRGSIGRIRA